MDTPYEKIKSYCESNAVSKLKQGYLLNKYYEEFLIETKGITSIDEKTGIQKALLSETTLTKNLLLAEEQFKIETDKKMKMFKRKNGFKEFGLSVLAGIVSTILYTIIIIFFFWFTQNQIKSWINDIYTTSNIEHNVTETEK